MTRVPRPRRPGARVFLAAAAAVVLLIGALTLQAVRAEQRYATRVLHDHAATAVWFFEQNFESELSSSLECAFHDALHVRDAGAGPQTLRTGIAQAAIPSVRRILDSWFAAEQCASVSLPRPDAAFRFGPGADVESIGAEASPATLVALRGMVEAAVQQRTPMRRSDGVVAGMVGDAAAVVLYSEQRVPGGTAIYAVPFEGSALAPVVERAIREFRLLPPPVLPDSARERVMRITVGLPGHPLYRTGPEGAATATEALLMDSVGGLVATAEITEGGAAILGQPTPAPGRVKALLGLLALSLAFVGLAYRQLRREQELAVLRGDFVASVSHELRTPLALQRILLDTIRLGRLSSPESLDRAHESLDREARRLEHLVDNILQFARSERGGIELAPRPTRLVEAVEAVAAAYRPLAEQRRMSIDIAGSEVEVPLDEPAFRRALGNVLENAIKYGPERQRITVQVTDDGDAAIVDVEDEGSGVPVGERSVVLEPFRRGRNAVGAAVAGSGIGLAVTREVMTLHGGRIELDASRRGGLRVRLLLPLRSARVATPVEERAGREFDARAGAVAEERA